MEICNMFSIIVPCLKHKKCMIKKFKEKKLKSSEAVAHNWSIAKLLRNFHKIHRKHH